MKRIGAPGKRIWRSNGNSSMPADPGCGKFRISCAARPARVMAAALRRGEDPLPEIQRLREENLSLQAERQMLLAELGLPGQRAGGYAPLPLLQ